MPSKPMELPPTSAVVVEGAMSQMLEAQQQLYEAMLAVGLDNKEAARLKMLAVAAPIGTALRALDALLAKNPKRAAQILEDAGRKPGKPRNNPK